MEPLIMYLLKSALWLSGFAIIYMVFLRKERFFLLKRIYLICGMIVSFVFPLITIHYQVEIPPPLQTSVIPVYDQHQSEQSAISVPAKNEFNYFYLLAAVYVSGVIFLIARNIFQFRNLLKAIQKSKIRNLGTAKLIRTSEFVSSFSFFNYVFVNPSVSENEVKEIMNHELVHVKQKHWLDLALGEFLRMLQWANPFAWIYTGFIRLNHEYLADEAALQRSTDPALYKAALLNQLFRSPVISLSNSFNYSITKTRFDMMKKIVTSPYRKLKILFVLPVFAIILYAFSTPEYNYIASHEKAIIPLTINEASPVKVNSPEISALSLPGPSVQNGVKGTVKDSEGKPVSGAVVVTTGTESGPAVTTDKDGNFTLSGLQNGVLVFISAPGYKTVTLKAVFIKPMDIRLEKDPDYKPLPQATRPEPLVIIDGVMTDKKFSEIRRELGHDFGTMTMLQGKQATDKYGEKASNGAVEILTRKKAIEMGLNPPYPRIEPDDFPTFRGENYTTIFNWVVDRVVYPEEAKKNNIEGWVTVNYTIEKDGSITIQPVADALQPLRNEIVRVLGSAPKFEPPKNPESAEPLNSSITLGFKLPDRIIKEQPFVVVEEMPKYPGGDAAILEFIKNNTKYPDELKKDKTEGRVIVRFIVTPEGTTEGISILKGLNSLMDAEAARVTASLKGWTPGMQGGKAVYVWYMCPVNFTPPTE